MRWIYDANHDFGDIDINDYHSKICHISAPGDKHDERDWDNLDFILQNKKIPRHMHLSGGAYNDKYSFDEIARSDDDVNFESGYKILSEMLFTRISKQFDPEMRDIPDGILQNIGRELYNEKYNSRPDNKYELIREIISEYNFAEFAEDPYAKKIAKTDVLELSVRHIIYFLFKMECLKNDLPELKKFCTTIPFYRFRYAFFEKPLNRLCRQGGGGGGGSEFIQLVTMGAQDQLLVNDPPVINYFGVVNNRERNEQARRRQWNPRRQNNQRRNNQRWNRR
jgi:hypothetical protein